LTYWREAISSSRPHSDQRVGEHGQRFKMPGAAQQLEQFLCCSRIRNLTGGPRVLDKFLTGRQNELTVTLLRDFTEPFYEDRKAPGKFRGSLAHTSAPRLNLPH
jgi:hypothetical protein